MAKTKLTIRRFTGLEQSLGDGSGQLDTAWEAFNMNTRHGHLSGCHGWKRFLPALPVEEPIVTLARFYRRSHPAPEVLVAATADTLWAYTDHWQQLGTGYASGAWDWVCYEDTALIGGQEQMTDVLLLTNPLDGMLALFGHDLSLIPIPTPAKFGFLARYKERIFGSGALDTPDSIYYSQPFDPTAWDTVEEAGVLLPEVSGGRIDAPTWDGDRFIALVPFGASLLAFKRQSVYRLYGADPGEFYLRDQYGADGPIAEDTVAVEADAAYLLSGAGLSVYDGSAVRPLRRDSLHTLWEAVDPDRLPQSQGAICGHIYYYTLPMASGGFRLMELDLTRGTLMAYDGPSPTCLLAWEDTLLFADSHAPGQLFALDPTADEGDFDHPALWVSPWHDGGTPVRVKSDFRLSGMLELTGDEPTACLSVTLETDRGSKTRTIAWPSGRGKKPFTLRLPCYGRRFRLKFASDSGHRFSLCGPLELSFDAHDL